MAEAQGVAVVAFVGSGVLLWLVSFLVWPMRHD